MLSEENIMKVLEAYDLTLSYRSAAELCGVDHHTVARYVAARQAGLDPLAITGPLRGGVRATRLSTSRIALPTLVVGCRP